MNTPREQNVSLWKERRRFPRFARSLRLTLLDTSKRLLDTDSTLVDISRKGLGLSTSCPRSPGETILFRFEVPGEGLVAGQAVTRWCRPDEDGFRYLSGAEIHSLAWGHSYRLGRFLGAGAGTQFGQMDFILIAACVGLGLWIIQDGALSGAAVGQQYLLDWFSWLPQLCVVSICLLGIYYLLRD